MGRAMSKPIGNTREHARANGWKLYRGRPCRTCGGTERYTNDWTCASCRRLNANKWRQRHYERALQLTRDWHAANPGRVKNLKLLKKFGMTIDEYDQRVAEQGGCCAICRQPCRSGRKLAVDHCHKTLRVRGLLCGNCNRALGLYKNDPAIVAAAVAYLEANRE